MLKPKLEGLARKDDAELPAFIRRCRHRQPATTVLSEKLHRAVAWTTLAQGAAAMLFEVTHCVASYQAWPGAVTLRAGWSSPFEYWPAMGFVTADRHAFIDIVLERDIPDRQVMGFDAMLRDALEQQGTRLITMAESALLADPRVDIAREVCRLAGTPTDEADAFQITRLLRSHGGGMTLGDLRAASPGHAPKACVLAMRRKLRLTLAAARLADVTVSLVNTAERH